MSMILTSTGSSTRRLVTAAPTVLLMRRSPAAARPALPPPRAAAGSCRSDGSRQGVPFLQDDLGGVRQILQVHRFHLARERLVLDHHVELAVAEPARDVEVARADPRPPPVRHGGLGVQHGAVPLEDAHARLQQRAITGSRERSEQGDVGSARHEEPHVHAVPRGGAERLHVGRRAGIVGVRQPQALASQRRDELIQAKQAGRVRHGRDDAQRGVAGGRDRGGRRGIVVGQRLTHQGPHLRERPLDRAARPDRAPRRRYRATAQCRAPGRRPTPARRRGP